MPTAIPIIRLAATVAVLGLLSTLVACAASPASTCDRSRPHNIGLVAGSTSNAPTPHPTTEIERVIAAASASNGSLTLAVPDGDGTAVGTVDLGSTASDEMLCRADHAANVAAAVALITAAQAETPELNFLTAIDSAARGAGSGSTIVVIGTGLQTTDPLNFAMGDLLYADAVEVAAGLERRGLLPSSLKGVEIIWSGIGDVSAPQSPPTVKARRNLISIWDAVLTLAGATLTVLTEPVTGAGPSSAPQVTPVTIRPEATESVVLDAPVLLRQSDLPFEGDTAEFLYKESAEITLAAVAEVLRSVPVVANSIIVTGVTARTEPQDDVADEVLSKLRAQAVIDVLVSLGVPAPLFVADGVGIHWCGFVDNFDESGFNPGLAAANRVVIITSGAIPLCT